MPYIKYVDRLKFSEERKNDNSNIVDVAGHIETEGELNYVITVLIQEYTKRKGLTYKTINEVMGVLNCASNEYYRRIAGPYEDKKIHENGDVINDTLKNMLDK